MDYEPYTISAEWLADQIEQRKRPQLLDDGDLDCSAARIILERRGVVIQDGHVVSVPEGCRFEEIKHKTHGYMTTIYGGQWTDGQVFSPEILTASKTLVKEFVTGYPAAQKIIVA